MKAGESSQETRRFERPRSRMTSARRRPAAARRRRRGRPTAKPVTEPPARAFEARREASASATSSPIRMAGRGVSRSRSNQATASRFSVAPGGRSFQVALVPGKRSKRPSRVQAVDDGSHLTCAAVRDDRCGDGTEVGRNLRGSTISQGSSMLPDDLGGSARLSRPGGRHELAIGDDDQLPRPGRRAAVAALQTVVCRDSVAPPAARTRRQGRPPVLPDRSTTSTPGCPAKRRRARWVERLRGCAPRDRSPIARPWCRQKSLTDQARRDPPAPPGTRRAPGHVGHGIFASGSTFLSAARNWRSGQAAVDVLRPDDAFLVDEESGRAGRTRSRPAGPCRQGRGRQATWCRSRPPATARPRAGSRTSMTSSVTQGWRRRRPPWWSARRGT
jgi:hypothetical protein